jgi:hypothetical protein
LFHDVKLSDAARIGGHPRPCIAKGVAEMLY